MSILSRLRSVRSKALARTVAPARRPMVKLGSRPAPSGGAGAIPDATSLAEHLQVALELELSTLPPYLCALYSIREGANREAAALIRSVLMEEMLHVVLVANVLNSIGGRPVLARPGILPLFPNSLPHSSGKFDVSLQPFSRQAIETFLRIEQPADDHAPPQGDHYDTIGQFYAEIGAALSDLGQQGLVRFDQRPECQVDAEHFYNAHGKIIRVVDLHSAHEALAEIVHQGEGHVGDQDARHEALKTLVAGENKRRNEGTHEAGPAGPSAAGASGIYDAGELAHYYRFMEIAVGRRYQENDSFASGPRGRVLEVDWSAVYPMAGNPRLDWFDPADPRRRHMEDCNFTFVRLLRALDVGLNGEAAQLRAAIPLMLELKEQTKSLMQIPSGRGETTLGPSFEWTDKT